MQEQVALVLAAFSPLASIVGAYVGVRVAIAEVRQVANQAKEEAGRAHTRMDQFLLERNSR